MDPKYVLLLVPALALVVGAVLLVAYVRLSQRRQVEKFGPPPPGHSWKTFAIFVGWCGALAATWFMWTWGPVVILIGTMFVWTVWNFVYPDWSWGLGQQFRDAGAYATALLMVVAFATHLAK